MGKLAARTIATRLPSAGLFMLGYAQVKIRVGSTVSNNVSAAAMSQEVPAPGYPTRPIRLVVPFPAGGGDTLARMVMTRTARELGQPIIIENMAGAGGNIGSQSGGRGRIHPALRH